MDTTLSPLATIGVDIGKEVFHIVGLSTDGRIALRRKIKRLARTISLAKSSRSIHPGQARRFDLLTVTSGVPLTSDIAGPSRDFRKVPAGDIAANSHSALAPARVPLQC